MQIGGDTGQRRQFEERHGGSGAVQLPGNSAKAEQPGMFIEMEKPGRLQAAEKILQLL